MNTFFKSFSPVDQKEIVSSVDPDETAHQQDIDCLLFASRVLANIPNSNNGLVQIQIRKDPLQELRDEGLKCLLLLFPSCCFFHQRNKSDRIKAIISTPK